MENPEKFDPNKADARALLALIVAEQGRRMPKDGLFSARLGFRFERILELAGKLYGRTESELAGFAARLVGVLARAFEERSIPLKRLDAQREKARAEGKGPWYLEPGLAAYMVYLDRFSKDLPGFESRIPYLEELGIKLVHFMPFMKSPEGNSDGGYAVSDYLSVDPRFGTNRDLTETSSLLHERGMYVAADLVLNHCADDHAWARAARAGDKRYRDYFYVFPDRSMPEAFEAAMPQVFPETAPGNFTWIPEMDSWVMTVFHNFQWDLNWSNPELFLEMLGILLGMANMGIDLVRLDAVPYLWKEAGSSCQNLNEAHDIVRLLKACADTVAPGVAFLAEAIVQPSEIVRYLDSGGVEECQLAYHASLMVLLWETLATKKTGVFSASFGNETRLPQGSAWLSYVRCHDDIGLGFDEAAIRGAGFDPFLHKKFLLDFYSGAFSGSFARGRLFMENPLTGDARVSGTCASLCGLEAALAIRKAGLPGGVGEVELALKRIELLYGLACSLVGIPMIFAGDELGLLNDYAWEADPEKKEDNRWMHRPPMDWAAAERRSKPGTIEARIFRRIAYYLARRRGISALAQDSPFEVLPSFSENILVCRRYAQRDHDSVIVVANFAPEARSLSIKALPLEKEREDTDSGEIGPFDLLENRRLKKTEGNILLEAYALVWIGSSGAKQG